MKICVTGTRGFPDVQGGVETHCEHLYPHIVKGGCEVSVITRRTYVDASLEEFKGINLVDVYNPKKKSFEAAVHTFLAVIKARKIGCDLLHVHAIGPALLIPFARLLGMKVVMTNHGPDYDRQKWGKLAKFMLRLGESLGSRFSNKVISISKPITDGLKHKYNCDSVIIPNGVVIPEILESEDALKQFGLEKNKYVLVVGRYVPEKGFHDLIKARIGTNLKRMNTNRETRIDTNLKRMNTNRETRIDTKDWKLVIVGDADHEDEYSKGLRAQCEGVEDIVLTGRLTGKPLQELYSHAGLFILPSYHEGLPIVLLEAMSYGLNCIVSDIPANRNVGLDDDRHFKAGDIEGMAAKIEEFIARPLTQEERTAQIEGVRENYDWEKIAGKTLGVYENVR